MTDDPTAHDGDRHAGHTAGGGGDGTARRRWLLRALVGLGVGLPVLIEARTFLGLIRVHLLGAGSGDGGTAGTPTATPEPAVGVGDELLAGTGPTETVREAHLRVVDPGWRFELSVAVENTTDDPYELRLGDVRTQAGETVDGDASTGRIPPGESAAVGETWTLPSENRPETLQVTALSHAGDGVDLTEASVPLGRVPLEG